MRLNILKEAMETINFQSTMVGARMELIIDRIIEQNYSEKELNNCKELVELSKLIYDELGLKIEFSIEYEILGAIRIEEIRFDHVFDKPNPEASATDMLKTARKLKGKSIVDIKNSRISGPFSEQANTMYLGYTTFFHEEKMTTKHKVAIMLHEIGHLFTLYEYANRNITTNQCIAFVSKSLMDKNNIKEHEYMISEASDILTGSKSTLKEFETVKDNKILISLMIDRSYRTGASELGTPRYDYTSSEYLADQFATRHGYGKELIELFDILNKSLFSKENSRIPLFFIEFATILRGTLLGLGAILFLTPVVGLFVIGSTIYYNVCNDFYSSKDYTYDNLQTRLKRIREQIIQYLKQLDKNDKKLIEKTLKDLDDTEKMIANTRVYESILSKIILFVSKKNRSIKEANQLQRDLEELTSNELFVKSAQLSTLKIK